MQFVGEATPKFGVILCVVKIDTFGRGMVEAWTEGEIDCSRFFNKHMSPIRKGYSETFRGDLKQIPISVTSQGYSEEPML